MKILYDGWIFSHQAAGGINRYFANIIDGLPEDYFPAITSTGLPKVNWPQNPRLKVLRPARFRPRRVSHRWEQWYFNRATDCEKYDIFHPSYYATLATKSWESYQCPIVLTVYDMTHERFADIMDSTGKYREEKRRAIAAAQAILCISQSTKRDLMQFYSVSESKITVTYLAAELNRTMAGDQATPSQPYLLYVGSRSAYKNFDGLVESLARILTPQDDTVLCIVGSALTDTENQKIAALGLSSRIRHFGYASDAQLAKLYAHSLAFVYPSLYEGFGIPPLEAMQCGTPVIACNRSSIPEVVGDAGILFDASDTNALADALRAVINGSIDRDALIARGYQQAQRFTWDKTVAQTANVYRSLTA